MLGGMDQHFVIPTSRFCLSRPYKKFFICIWVCICICICNWWWCVDQDFVIPTSRFCLSRPHPFIRRKDSICIKWLQILSDFDQKISKIALKCPLTFLFCHCIGEHRLGGKCKVNLLTLLQKVPQQGAFRKTNNKKTKIKRCFFHQGIWWKKSFKMV